MQFNLKIKVAIRPEIVGYNIKNFEPIIDQIIPD